MRGTGTAMQFARHYALAAFLLMLVHLKFGSCRDMSTWYASVISSSAPNVQLKASEGTQGANTSKAAVHPSTIDAPQGQVRTMIQGE